jgi:DNA-binding beta-propeller fold protein YncE
MRFLRKLSTFTGAAALFGLILLQSARGGDVLFIGDGSDNTVKRFDAETGAPLDPPGQPFVSGVLGPRGLVIDGDTLLVVNQNVGLSVPGEVLGFDAATGAFIGAVIAATDKDAPFAPRGIALGDEDDLFVANLTTASGTSPGRVNRYDLPSGDLLASTLAKGFKNKEYHPRAMVFGPDGLLYVSVRTLKKDGLGGGVLRFNSDGDLVGVLVEDAGGVGQLNRPEGLVFGPDGNLYITSFSAGPGDPDAIRIYRADGTFLGKIDLSAAGQPRAFAQALLFGPGGKLFVPITNTGEVRSYDVAAGSYDVLVPAGTADLVQAWYLTFGKTDPSTLAYRE